MPKKITINKESLEFIVNNFQDLSWKELSKVTGYSNTVLRRIAKDLGLLKKRKRNTLYKARIVCYCQNPLCGIEFKKTQCDIQRGGGKYCSGSCQHISQLIPVPDKETLQKAYDSGKSTNDLATMFKVSKGTIYNLFQKYQIKGRPDDKALKVFYKTKRGREAIVQSCKTKLKKYGTLALGYPKTSFKNSFRKDLNIRVRSMWEANFLRYLKYEKIQYCYEPRTFFFEGLKRGKLAYLPDLYLPEKDLYIEIKGRLWPGDKGKLRNFKKFYPEEFAKLRCVVSDVDSPTAKYFVKLGIPVYVYYKEITNKYKNIVPHWGE